MTKGSAVYVAVRYALESNIKKVFDIEGVEELGAGTFSAEAVEVNAAAAERGKGFGS